MTLDGIDACGAKARTRCAGNVTIVFFAPPMLNEFGLIDRFFKPATDAAAAPLIALGIGDDCALLRVPEGQELAVSTDMLVEGRHFIAGSDARRLGHKALAVNLSDLAAMGATPVGFTLALALPRVDEAWLTGFSEGMLALASQSGCALCGGDTTAGPLTLSLTVFGLLPRGSALRRDRAQPGDRVWVSGSLGLARFGLGLLRAEWDGATPAEGAAAIAALEAPTPRLALGLALRDVAHAAIDISDGLVGDLQHIVDASGVSARIDADAIPICAALARQPEAVRRQCAIAGGDDYELCFTAPASASAQIEAIARQLQLPLTAIGTIEAQSAAAAPSIAWVDAAQAPLDLTLRGFDHFNRE